MCTDLQPYTHITVLTSLFSDFSNNLQENGKPLLVLTSSKNDDKIKDGKNLKDGNLVGATGDDNSSTFINIIPVTRSPSTSSTSTTALLLHTGHKYTKF